MCTQSRDQSPLCPFSSSKINRAKKVPGCIKYALNDAPQSVKLLAYTSLCRPILEYADAQMHNLADTTSILEFEAVKNRAI